MAQVELKNVSKVYEGQVTAVKEVSLTVRDEEFLVLVGPSGCGKSTVLRMIAGLEEISSGSVSIDGRVVNDVAPKDRDIAMVFQNYALYPHMSVRENLGFGLRLRRFGDTEIDKRVVEASAALGISEYLDRKPKALSGGQRQRVALGRAIVRQPKVFLFDEPLSNLDANLRVQMRTEITRLHQRLRTTMIYVTHDQIEAMSMGDRIVVMKDGAVHQIDTPLKIYHRPVNRFVAGFIGSPTMNFFSGSIVRNGALTFRENGSAFTVPLHPETPLTERSSVVLGVRPEHLSNTPQQGRPAVSVHVEVVEPVGNEVFAYFSTGSGRQFVARLSSDHPPAVQQPCTLSFDTSRFHFFDETTGDTLLKET